MLKELNLEGLDIKIIPNSEIFNFEHLILISCLAFIGKFDSNTKKQDLEENNKNIIRACILGIMEVWNSKLGMLHKFVIVTKHIALWVVV